MPSGASSRSGPGLGSDGTHGIQCWLCRQNVGRTTESITRVLCAICHRMSEEGAAENGGVPLTAEALREYYASRAQLSSTSMLLLEDTPPVTIPGRKKFNIAALGEGVNAAIGFLRRKPAEDGAAATLAKSKKRGKLLDGLSVEDTTSNLGGMQDVDAMLTRNHGDS